MTARDEDVHILRYYSINRRSFLFAMFSPLSNERDEPFLKAGEEGIEMKERMAAVKAQVRKIR